MRGGNYGHAFSVHYGQGVCRSSEWQEETFWASPLRRDCVVGAMCPNCQGPLLSLLTLNAGDPRLNLRDSAFAHPSLIYCWTCSIAAETLFYRIRGDDSIELLKFGEGHAFDDDFPYPDYPESFPLAYATLAPLAASEQDVIQNGASSGCTD